MTQPLTTWTVLPHGKLTAIEDELLRVVGEIRMPLVGVPQQAHRKRNRHNADRRSSRKGGI